MTDKPELVRQSYGIAMAQGVFGGPRGVWLECRSCDESQRIKNSVAWIDKPDKEVAAVFRAHGWTGKGDRMLRAQCPRCSAQQNNEPETPEQKAAREVFENSNHWGG